MDSENFFLIEDNCDGRYDSLSKFGESNLGVLVRTGKRLKAPGRDIESFADSRRNSADTSRTSNSRDLSELTSQDAAKNGPRSPSPVDSSNAATTISTCVFRVASTATENTRLRYSPFRSRGKTVPKPGRERWYFLNRPQFRYRKANYDHSSQRLV
ncbi:uncharacterized protein LOC143377892 [Andrena cerasifolii]|uniref:uncharacterized protein LOC143377892 n=1 Tax=Andrena cerasifolii TaxID=2819439 RepID=UPI0040384395